MKNAASLHRSLRIATLFAILLGTILGAAVASAAGSDRLFYLHHSTGRGFMIYGEARSYLEKVNRAGGTEAALWDHDYNFIGLLDAQGDALGYNYAIPDDDTDPRGLHRLWTTANAARDSILSDYDVIAFMSCFTACSIGTDSELEQNKIWYLEIRDVMDQHPDKQFLVMSPPPLHPGETSLVAADRARAFSQWLGSNEFLADRPNLHFMDVFDLLAHADDGSGDRNQLKAEYQRPGDPDSHPNVSAYQMVAPLLIGHMMEAAGHAVASVPEFRAPANLAQNQPNPFNPITEIVFELERSGNVALRVYSARGELVRELLHETRGEGRHRVTWDGRDSGGAMVGSGTYLYRLEAPGWQLSRKMVLTK